MNYIITNNREFFEKIGDYNYCNLEDMVLPMNLAVDTETTALYPRDGNLFAIQIGTGKDNYLIDLQLHNNGLKPEQVFPYLEGKNLVFHNATFDLGWFYKHNFFPKNVYDTMLASQLLYNGIRAFRHSFGHVMERELDLDYDKSEQKNIHNIQLRTTKAIQYCFNDVDRLLDLMAALVKKVRKRGLTEAFKLHCRYVRVLAYMEQCGMPISEERWDEKMIQDVHDQVKAEKDVKDYIFEHLPQFRDLQYDMVEGLFGEGLGNKITQSLTSNKQMIPVFQAFNINTTTDKGKTSINKDVIKQTPHEFVDLWLKFQEANHDITTYGQNIKDKIVDGRIYTSFNPILDTARISTRRGGINFLNFPANEKTRRCIQAKEGWKMIVCDYEGQENVVGADLHRDPMMVASLNDGLDLHCAFARMIFPELEELSDDEIKKNHSDKRSFSKSPRFAFAYGGTGYTVAVNQNLPIKEGMRLETLFRELHSGVYEWGDRKLEDALEKGYIESVDGFRLNLSFFKEFKENEAKIRSFSTDFWTSYKLGKSQYKKKLEYEAKIEAGEEAEYFEIYDRYSYNIYMKNKKLISQQASKRSEYYRLCLNNPIQSTSAFQTKRAACILFERIEAEGDLWNVRINNIPHDEMVLEVREDLADKYKVILEESMIAGGEHYLTSGLVKMNAEANIGDDWYEAK